MSETNASWSNSDESEYIRREIVGAGKTTGGSGKAVSLLR